MGEVDILCPYPLLSSYSDIDTTIVVPGSNCVVPCPSIVYTDKEWYVFQNTIAILIYISFFASSLTLISHMAFQKGPNLYIRKMFIAGFVGNSFVISLFMLANRDNNIVCNGSTHYVKHKGLCVTQAFCTIFFLLWTEVWAAILALDTLLHISSWVKLTDINSLHRKYTIAAIIISTVPCLIPLAIGNLGFDPYANIPICLFLSLDNGNTTSKFFWGVFFWPFYLFLLVTIIFTVYGAVKLHKIFVTSNSYFRNKNNTSSSNLEAQRSGEGIIGLRMNNNPIHDNASMSQPDSHASSLTRGERAGMGKSIVNSGNMNNNKSNNNTNNHTNNNTNNNNSSSSSSSNNNNNHVMTINTKIYSDNNNNNNNIDNKSGNTVTNSDRKRDDDYDIYNGRTDVSKDSYNDAFNLNSATTSTVSNPRTYSTSTNQTHNQKKKNVPRDYSVNFQSQSNSQMNGDLAIALYSGATPYANDNNNGNNNNDDGEDGDGRFITDVFFNDDDDSRHNNGGRGNNAPDVLSRSVNRSLNSELYTKDASSSSHSVSMASNSYSNRNRAGYNDNDNDQDEYGSNRGSELTSGSEHDINHRYGSEFEDTNTAVSPFSSVDKTRASSQDSRFKSTLRATFANSDVRTALANIWKYNGRSIQFVAVFCLTTLCVAPCTLHVYYFEYGKYIDSTNEYVECLMTSAVTAQTINPSITQSEVNQQAKEACGVQPSRIPPIWEVLVIMVWVSAYGIVPAIIFGGFMDPLKWLYNQFIRIVREKCGLGMFSSSSPSSLSSSSSSSGKTSTEDRDIDRHYVITDDEGNVITTSTARERSQSSTNSGS